MQSHLQPVALMPEGPAEPLVCRAAEWMAAPLEQSKMTGWVSSGVQESIRMTWLAWWVLLEQIVTNSGGRLMVISGYLGT